MKDVRLEISGRTYTVACAPGEEKHLEMLGRMIDSKIASFPNLAGQSDARRFLYAALFLADELHERQQSPQDSTSPQLEQLAGRLEALADALEGVEAALTQPEAE